jgi:hypothetical protein
MSRAYWTTPLFIGREMPANRVGAVAVPMVDPGNRSDPTSRWPLYPRRPRRYDGFPVIPPARISPADSLGPLRPVLEAEPPLWHHPTSGATRSPYDVPVNARASGRSPCRGSAAEDRLNARMKTSRIVLQGLSQPRRRPPCAGHPDKASSMLGRVPTPTQPDGSSRGEGASTATSHRRASPRVAIVRRSPAPPHAPSRGVCRP